VRNNHRVLLLYGIETIPGAGEERNWNTRLEGLWELQDQPFSVAAWQWSGLFWKYAVGVFTWLPWYRKRINAAVLRDLADIEAWLDASHPVDYKLSMVCHSYAGTILQTAFEQGWRFHRIIMIATTMDEDFDWHKYDAQFGEVLIHWSPKDNVVGQSTYGRQGLVGPKVQHPRVHVLHHPARKHFDWIKPDVLAANAVAWADFLKR
jgi:hypothetical protein